MSSRVSSVTWNHDEIRRWAEERGGVPAAPKGTARGKGHTGVVRIDFPTYRGQGTLRQIGWDEFFDKFDDHNLALVYEEWNTRGQRSNVNRLVSRDSLEGGGTTRRRRRARTVVAAHAVRARRASGTRSRTRRSTTSRPAARKTTRARKTARRISGVRRARSSTSARTSRSRSTPRVARKGTGRSRTGVRGTSRKTVASRRRRTTRTSRR